MSEEEEVEIMSNADASYGGTTDQESVISAEEALSFALPRLRIDPEYRAVDVPGTPEDEEDEEDIPRMELPVLPQPNIRSIETLEPSDLEELQKYTAELEKMSPIDLVPQEKDPDPDPDGTPPKPSSEELLRQIPSSENTKTTKELIAEVADYVHSCRVCYDLFHQEKNQARILCCGHSFCTRCIVGCSHPSNFNRDIPFGVKCPECRRVSQQAPASMPINFQLMQILTVLSLVKNPDSDDEADEKYYNFERLGQIVPENELSQMSMEDLHEHSKVVFRAMRQRAEIDKKNVTPNISKRIFEGEITKFDEIERSIDKIMRNMDRAKQGDPPLPFPDITLRQFRMRVEERERDRMERENRDRVINNDWMREMVVYPPPEPPAPQNPPFLYPIVAPQANQIDALLQQEAVAREEADPRRNLDVVREAHFRRERESAQQRETQRINERILDRLLHPNDDEERRIQRNANHIETLRQFFGGALGDPINQNRPDPTLRFQNAPHEPRIDDPVVSDSTSSDDSSYIEEEPRPRLRPPVIPIPEPIFSLTPKVTSGECVTAYRIMQVFIPSEPNFHHIAPRTMADILVSRNTFQPNGEAIQSDLFNVMDYARLLNINAVSLIQVCRDYTLKYASMIYEAPRLLNRFRRRRAAAADEYNALLTVIRRRAKEALRGNRPDQPINEEEANLTMRLIVNIANSMGVREQLENALCPHRESLEGVFSPVVTTSSRHPTVFCNVCRCTIPQTAQADHAQGRRHVSNVSRRQNTIGTSSSR